MNFKKNLNDLTLQEYIEYFQKIICFYCCQSIHCGEAGTNLQWLLGKMSGFFSTAVLFPFRFYSF